MQAPLGGIIFAALLIWPIIVNSQPGTTFRYLGIDWKADNLDNTLFWTAIVLMFIASIGGTYNEKLKTKIKDQDKDNWRDKEISK
jgi:hypothetical protein